ncbi:MAG TPA: DUF1292 domain-containing protein [Peptococcaceae bacterium]|nr:DUF1292 domain-containing protein [Clostridia bacterium]HOB81559.1 DUF1292 domain-containing protein [Peptococcaceae bacterium]HPZ71682.1 DUF1292 domain-containing protein [Peptococcaceae bacterium]HQD53646.1 DUF1292 domain-containing protein [Peptococcaceae bacterium]
MVDQNENVVLVDENGEEHEFALIDVIEVDGEEYAILEPLEADEDADEDQPEAIILKIGQDENGEEILYDIEDDDEWEMVAQKWQEMIEEEEEEE